MDMAQLIAVLVQGGFAAFLALVIIWQIPWMVNQFRVVNDLHSTERSAADKMHQAELKEILVDRSKTSDAIDKLCDATTAGFIALKEHQIDQFAKGRHDLRSAMTEAGMVHALRKPGS